MTLQRRQRGCIVHHLQRGGRGRPYGRILVVERALERDPRRGAVSLTELERRLNTYAEVGAVAELLDQLGCWLRLCLRDGKAESQRDESSAKWAHLHVGDH